MASIFSCHLVFGFFEYSINRPSKSYRGMSSLCLSNSFLITFKTTSTLGTRMPFISEIGTSSFTVTSIESNSLFLALSNRITSSSIKNTISVLPKCEIDDN